MKAHTSSFLSCQLLVMEVCIVCNTVSKLMVLPTGVELFSTTITITTTASIPTTAVSHSGALAGNVLDH
jgi:hypothetical protein